jgi:FtsP/CotA-like multicopper oxidase with cupredoxin domain
MEPISRRRALQLGGLGLTAVATGAVGVAATWPAPSTRVTGTGPAEPPVLRSANGLLEVQLVAAQGRLQVADREATTLSYNGGLPGPTLHLLPGDHLRVELVNRLTEVTNLHVHGLHVSPQGNGDNIFVAVDPGRSFTYDYRLPADHPPGVYWYHPHHHGSVADQIFGGLYGAIVVDDRTPLPAIRERVVVLSDISLDAAGRVRLPSAMEQMMGREGALVLVNGRTAARLQARPGERERWRIVNASVARYLRLRLDGQQLQLLGIDSGRYPAPQEVHEIVLATGNRADLLVTTVAGTSELRVLPYDRGSMMGMGAGTPGMGGTGTGSSGDGPRVLATLDVTGDPAPPPAAVPALPAPRDLRGAAVDARRELTFATGMGMGMRFTIDGKSFDPARIDQTVRAGAVEEWTVTNTSPMDHPLHLHVWPMQVIEQGGRRVDLPTWQDVVNVPAQSTVRVRIAFDDFVGRTVYHCHVLDHEDRGMMAVIEAR